jgi:hypothetical protein
MIINLGDQIAEAEQNSWLGEVEGLKISLASAGDKLAHMERADVGPVPLDIPKSGREKAW